MEELSDHFSWAEAVVTTHREIENVIPDKYVPFVRNTAKNLERVRALLGHPMTVLSWYRCLELNTSIGGAKLSQHLQGEAVDFICPKYGSPLDIIRKITKYPELIKWDQLIYEHTWVHISFSSIPNRNQRGQVLTLLKSGGYAQGITDKAGNPV